MLRAGEKVKAALKAGFLKGQITVEFLVVVIVLLFIFNFALAIYSNNSLFLSNFEEKSEAMEISERIGNALNSVFFAGNGASSEFEFFSGRDFNASIHSNVLTVRSSNAFADFALATSGIDFEGFEFGKKLVFSNIEGVVIVEKAE
jgi:hypothetical protein